MFTFLWTVPSLVQFCLLMPSLKYFYKRYTFTVTLYYDHLKIKLFKKKTVILYPASLTWFTPIFILQVSYVHTRIDTHTHTHIFMCIYLLNILKSMFYGPIFLAPTCRILASPSASFALLSTSGRGRGKGLWGPANLRVLAPLHRGG